MHEVQLASIDLNLLVVLDALLTERSVTRAATRLGRTQSAMSHALGRLRELLDDPILIRTPRGMLPTPRAAQLVEPIRRALGDIQRAIAARPEFDPRAAQRGFTLALSDYNESVLLPPLLSRMSEEGPGIDLEVRHVATEIERALEAGSIDLAVVVAHEPLPGIYRQPLFKERFVCVVREDHPTVKRRLSMDEFLKLSHVLVSPRGGAGGFVDDALAKQGLRRRVAVRVPHFLVAPLIVASSNLCLTLPERVAKAFSGFVPLRTVTPPLELPGFTMTQIWHERHHLDPGHAWLRGLLAEVAQKI